MRLHTVNVSARGAKLRPRGLFRVGTAIELEFIERGDRILSFRVRRELHESEAARATRFSIGADVDADDLSRRCECLVETILCRVEAQVPDEYFPWNGCFLPFES